MTSISVPRGSGGRGRAGGGPARIAAVGGFSCLALWGEWSMPACPASRRRRYRSGCRPRRTSRRRGTGHCWPGWVPGPRRCSPPQTSISVDPPASWSNANAPLASPGTGTRNGGANGWPLSYTAPRPVASLPENGARVEASVAHDLLNGPVRARTALPWFVAAVRQERASRTANVAEDGPQRFVP